MLMYYLLGLNAGIFFILLVLFGKQLLSGSLLDKSNQRLEEQLTRLAQQNQNTEQQLRENLLINLNKLQQILAEKLAHSRLEQLQAFSDHRARFDERQMETLKILQDTLQKGVQDNRDQVKQALNDYAKELGKRVDQLTQTTENKLKEINQHVEND